MKSYKYHLILLKKILCGRGKEGRENMSGYIMKNNETKNFPSKLESLKIEHA